MHNGMGYLEEEKGITFANLSIASMGFATNNCGKSPIDVIGETKVTLFFQCQGGFGVQEVLSSGVMDNSLEDEDGNKLYSGIN